AAELRNTAAELRYAAEGRQSAAAEQAGIDPRGADLRKAAEESGTEAGTAELRNRRQLRNLSERRNADPRNGGERRKRRDAEPSLEARERALLSVRRLIIAAVRSVDGASDDAVEHSIAKADPILVRAVRVKAEQILSGSVRSLPAKE